MSCSSSIGLVVCTLKWSSLHLEKEEPFNLSRLVEEEKIWACFHLKILLSEGLAQPYSVIIGVSCLTRFFLKKKKAFHFPLRICYELLHFSSVIVHNRIERSMNYVRTTLLMCNLQHWLICFDIKVLIGNIIWLHFKNKNWFSVL